MKKLKDSINLKLIFVILCICMAIPSCLYIIKGKTIIELGSSYSFFINPSNQIFTPQKIVETILFMGLWIGIAVLYFYFIKHHGTIFPTWKSMIRFVLIVAVLFIIILPMTSTDIFYYIGTGWSEAHYGVNPYYTSVDQLMENNEQAAEDTMLLKMKGTWSGQTIVYGPIWPLVCRVLSYLSFGNLGLALFIYKLFNLLLHLANTYLVYKITGQSKKYSILYALNPLILFEGLSNVHNEMLVIFFVLGAIYFLIKKKKMLPAIVMLACATAVKYFAILLAPFFVLYYYRKENILRKIGYSFLWALVFLVVFGTFYGLYMRDFNILKGILTQQEKIANSFFACIAIRNYKFAITLSKGCMLGYIIIYVVEILKLFNNKKECTWEEMIKKYNGLLVLFIFMTITNLQPWYFIWILPTIFWQKDDTRKTLQAMTIIATLSTVVYFLFKESYIFGQYYIFVFAFLILLFMILQKKELTNQ